MPNEDSPSIAPTTAEKTAFQKDLITWYHREGRVLPWRKTDDPYRIWVSEIMLQQTRVDQAIPYYHRFLKEFPTVEKLAAADRDDVLRQWEGLGYYSRARRLHDAAGQVVREFGGQVPDTEEEILELPGVGPYTAAAVLSIAYDKPYAVVDGNVLRVLSRVYAVDRDIKKYASKRMFRELANELLPVSEPEAFNQAIMELGATVCTPQNPSCESCPVQTVCQAHANGMQTAFPVKGARKPVPHYNIAIGLVFNEANELLIARRPEDGMLGGLWEFPGGKQEEGESLAETCAREMREEMSIEVEVGPLFHKLDHAYSHLKITLHAFPCRIKSGTPTPEKDVPFHWVTTEELSDYAFPRANRHITEKLQERSQQPDLFDPLPI